MPNVRALFCRHNLRCTRQRVGVYRALASTKSHPTAETLHRMVQGAEPGMSLATVYNTLEALCQAGLARKIANVDGAARFDADLSDHAHFVTDDGRVFDVPPDLSRSIRESLPPDFRGRLERSLGSAQGVLNIPLRPEAEPAGGR